MTYRRQKDFEEVGGAFAITFLFARLKWET
jgi:hypothetical protein